MLLQLHKMTHAAPHRMHSNFLRAKLWPSLLPHHQCVITLQVFTFSVFLIFAFNNAASPPPMWTRSFSHPSPIYASPNKPITDMDLQLYISFPPSMHCPTNPSPTWTCSFTYPFPIYASPHKSITNMNLKLYTYFPYLRIAPQTHHQYELEALHILPPSTHLPTNPPPI